MRLNPPSLILFMIAGLLAGLAVVTKLGISGMPHYFPHQDFWLAFAAYLTLMFASVVRGL